MPLKSLLPRPWFTLPRPWLTLMFFALILVTRTNSDNFLLNPPDATLGAFFLAGLWGCAPLTFGLLFSAGVLADLFSFALGVSDWCFTSAYVFLVPTYACLWYAGGACRSLDVLRAVDLVKIVAWLMVGCIGAYFVSSHSFFLFSGRYPATMTSVEYWSKILPHFPRYIEWAYIYAAMGLAIAAMAKKYGHDIHAAPKRAG